MICEKCGGALAHYDRVDRVVRTGFGKRYSEPIERMRCRKCGATFRQIPDKLYARKQYEASIIDGFLSGALDISMLEYEDYPTEQTIQNWIRAFGTR